MELIRETRINTYVSETLKTRAYQSDEGKRFIDGYASVFNQRSKLLYEYIDGKYQEFYEVILPGAFDNILRSETIDVRLAYNHNFDTIIGRYTKINGEVISNSLELSVDDYGLKYRTEVPGTTLSNDLFISIGRGDLFENSFQFSIIPDDEKTFTDTEGNLIREIHNISGLYDVSVVTSGAYANTKLSVNSRGLAEIIKDKEKIENKEEKSNINYYKKRLEVLKK
jgi:HK97 family phage prohead protease